VRKTIAVFCVLSLRIFAQNTCDAPPAIVNPKGSTIFSPEQEGYLGEIIAEAIQQRQLVYRQPALLAPVERIAARLQQYLPRNQYFFQLSLVEIPEANAFALPGGRIYISRRLIAFVQSEDELAGVIAHEMGHIVARQSSMQMTRTFKKVLGVTDAGDRDDIFRKFNQLLDNANRKPGSVSRDEIEDDQQVADRVSLEVAWRAGYDPQGLPRFLDRLTQNKGATGNFFSDLFGLTRPESKRLRELIKGIETIPAACRQPHENTGDAAFHDWQKTVAELSREDLTVAPSSLSPTLRLSPKLRPEVTNIKFSPDGRLLLAQDESGVHILQREPLQYLFRIPALEARAATFDKDSKRILFDAGSRLEFWNLETRAREKLWQPEANLPCREVTPSPDGHFAACFVGLNEVRLLGLEDKQELARHSFPLNPLSIFTAILRGEAALLVHGQFSPDGAAFLMTTSSLAPSRMQVAGALNPAGSCCDTWAFDLNRKSEFAIGKPLRGKLGNNFAFMGANRIVAMDPYDFRASGLFSWPDGKLLNSLTVPPWPLAPAAHGSIVFLRPFDAYGVGAMDTETKEIVVVNRNAAMDRYDDVSAAEQITGQIALYPGNKIQPVATLQLPEADLGRLRSATHSPDLEWLAISVQSRGMIWNLRTGKANAYLPFTGGTISAKGLWTTTFEQREKNANGRGDKPVSMRVNINLQNQAEATSVKLPEKEEGRLTRFTEKYEVTSERDTPAKGKTTFTVKDTVAERTLWTRELDSPPTWFVAGALALEFSVRDKEAERLIKEAPELKSRLDALPKRDDVVLIDVLALDTGQSLGRVFVDRGGNSVLPRSMRVAGRTLFIEDNNNRTLAYSLDTGERSGQQFGRVLAVDGARGQVGVQNDPGAITIYDHNMKPVTNFKFPGNIIYAGFDASGQRLLAVTGAQEVFIEDLP